MLTVIGKESFGNYAMCTSKPHCYSDLSAGTRRVLATLYKGSFFYRCHYADLENKCTSVNKFSTTVRNLIFLIKIVYITFLKMKMCSTY